MSDESPWKLAHDFAIEEIKRQLARPPETAHTQGERIDVPTAPYLADLPRKVVIKGELQVTEYGLRELEAIAREASQQSDELTEVCQLLGKALYVRLDWRDKEQAKEEYDRIRATIEEAFKRAGWIERQQVSREPLPPNYQLVKDKALEQWWIIGNGDILIPHAIGNYDEAYALALHLSREGALRDVNTEVGEG